MELKDIQKRIDEHAEREAKKELDLAFNDLIMKMRKMLGVCNKTIRIRIEGKDFNVSSEALIWDIRNQIAESIIENRKSIESGKFIEKILKLEAEIEELKSITQDA